VLNAYVHDVTMDEVLELREGLLLTLHVDMIMKLQKDREFHAILDHFDIITCDSQILYFATRFLGSPVRERVSGSDYFPRFYMRYRDDPSVTVFLMGGKPGIAEIAARNVNAKVGREMVVGTCAPPFDFDRDPAEIERMIAAVNALGPACCWWASAEAGRRSSLSATATASPTCGCSCRSAAPSTTRRAPSAVRRAG
jgi:N-acetylglucosaminyldiphosphoundecaprenol N-acetyl-beta-D-mannosaminyltransferase